MNKNTVIGTILLLAVIFGYYYIYPPQNIELNDDQQEILDGQKQEIKDTEEQKQEKEIIKEKIIEEKIIEEEIFTIENNLIKLYVSNKGGMIKSVEIKNYYKYNENKKIKENVILFNNNDTLKSIFNLELSEKENSKEKFFTPNKKNIIVNNNKDVSSSLILKYNNLEFVYTLKHNQYLLNFDINGLEKVTKSEWKINYLSSEKSIKNEKIYCSIVYKDSEKNKIKKLSERKDDQKSPDRTDWINLKNQFFSSILIAEDDNIILKPKLSSKDLFTKDKNNKTYVKELTAKFNLSSQNQNLKFYFGPNDYKLLKQVGGDLGKEKEYQLEKTIPMGKSIFGLVNKILIIPVFDFLSSFISNYGIIILILTVFIKLLLFPFTYKSYVSQIKMKLIKPEIDEINAKYKEQDKMKAQQETMKLYSRSGVSPFGGCLPMLVQFPILIAMFRFFPSSIQLRQQGFLWADDLSSYDSIASLPWDIPMYGDHISLFTLLMTVSTIIYTRMNSQMGMAGQNQMPQMKYMMYLMPIMFLGFFNNYAAALSYYYFLANIITFGQQFIIKKYIIKESVLLKQIEDRRKNPKKKSGFMKRLEEAQRQQRMKMKK